jgi:hypothetical protein
MDSAIRRARLIPALGGLITIDASEQSKIEIDDKAEKTTNS